MLKVDTERVRIERDREVIEKEELLLSIIGTPAQVTTRLLTIQPKGKAQAGWTPRQCLLEEARKSLGSNTQFVELLRAEGIEPPRKISPAYFKHRDESKKYAWAFSKTDLEFTSLQEHPNKRVRELVEARLAVKSTLSAGVPALLRRSHRPLVGGQQDEHAEPAAWRRAAQVHHGA